jgi:hypothetical protein
MLGKMDYGLCFLFVGGLTMPIPYSREWIPSFGVFQDETKNRRDFAGFDFDKDRAGLRISD